VGADLVNGRHPVRESDIADLLLHPVVMPGPRVLSGIRNALAIGAVISPRTTR